MRGPWGTGRNRGKRLRRIGAGLGVCTLIAGLTLGTASPARAVDLVDWYGPGYQTQNVNTAGSDPTTGAESRGVVLIDTQLYDGSGAAGTGIVLTSSGTVVTNYHVVEGSVAIRVTDASTGRTYTAKLVGADQKSDIAVLQLQHASGLRTATIDNNAVRVGDNVTAVGNAGGTGTLTAADGEVTGLKQQITTQAEAAVAGETLSGLIQTDANVQPGDSGGPLLDSQGEVTGIDAAAAANGPAQAYAIPINTALGIVHQIESGRASADIRIGPAAYLGVQVTTATTANAYSSGGWGSYDSPWGNYYGNYYGNYGGNQAATAGAEIVGVGAGTPAARAGLAAGDVITSVGSTTVDSAGGLTNALRKHRPGDQVTIGWTDANGGQQTTSVTLGSSPVN